MAMQTNKINQLLELANFYPSPHNGQPIRLKQISDTQFDVYFERSRGLQASDISFIFSFVSMGVFIQYLVYCAYALGHGIDYTLGLPSEAELKGNGPVKCASVTIIYDAIPPDIELEQALRFRQTSRKKYSGGLSDEVTAEITAHASKLGMTMNQLNPDQAKQTIWLNQRAVFDDMFDPAVREELDHWLRYSRKEKEAKQDGLSYDCMELNGPIMKYIVHHPGLLRAPGISQFIKQYYLRTMADSSSVFYMLAPFANEAESFQVGVAIMDTWLSIARRGYYLHPFGTIMSNHNAHRDFLQLAGITNETRENYLVFIFRAGSSKPPVRSLRLPYETHLVME